MLVLALGQAAYVSKAVRETSLNIMTGVPHDEDDDEVDSDDDAVWFDTSLTPPFPLPLLLPPKEAPPLYLDDFGFLKQSFFTCPVMPQEVARLLSVAHDGAKPFILA